MNEQQRYSDYSDLYHRLSDEAKGEKSDEQNDGVSDVELNESFDRTPLEDGKTQEVSGTIQPGVSKRKYPRNAIF